VCHIGANDRAVAPAAKAAGGDLKKLRAVDYKSSAESLAGLMSGDLDIVASTISNVVALMGAHEIRMIAISSAHRLGGVFSGATTRDSR
jgi:putative tricarboxylic transport membrane protein